MENSREKQSRKDVLVELTDDQERELPQWRRETMLDLERIGEGVAGNGRRS